MIDINYVIKYMWRWDYNLCNVKNMDAFIKLKFNPPKKKK